VIPDLIVSDVMMPKMTGFDFCEQIKADMLTCHIPILLLTVKSDLESRLESFKKGADAYLSKPFESDELVIRLEALLASKQRIRDFYQSTTSPGDETNVKEAQDPLIRNLNDLIYENMDDSDFGIAQICRKMGISRAQLYRKVEALTGQPVGLYINTIKLNRAIQLLRTTALNVSEIAYSVGFKDPAYFSRQFKKTFGKSPSAFRQQ
ncbi:MAG: helix-turn-helix domain-containing protein, partial [Saprospiraceae bacterium]|nr:helix-turn-helix domain-containing protein [Saprospiraceae bacterium]